MAFLYTMWHNLAPPRRDRMGNSQLVTHLPQLNTKHLKLKTFLSRLYPVRYFFVISSGFARLAFCGLSPAPSDLRGYLVPLLSSIKNRESGIKFHDARRITHDDLISPPATPTQSAHSPANQRLRRHRAQVQYPQMGCPPARAIAR